MAPSKKLSQLASRINRHVGTIEDALHANGGVSSGPDAPLITPLSIDLEESRLDLLEALDELRALVRGPIYHLADLLLPLSPLISMLHVIYKFGLARHLPLDRPLSYAELAQRCGLPEDVMHQVLRLAISHRIFAQPEQDKVGHNAISAAMAVNPLLNDWIGQYIEEYCPASTKLVEALQTYPGSEEASESAVAIANGSQGDFFSVIKKDPARLERFANAMKLLASFGGNDVSGLVEGMKWDENCPKVIVDVGGSDGSLSHALLRRFDGIQMAIVQDQPDVIAGKKVPADLKGRLEYQSYDLFAEQPIQGADVYLFRAILHDWSDKYAIKILQNLIPALKPGAKICVHEYCLRDLSPTSLSRDQLTWALDLLMKAMLNAKERTSDQWHALFAAADRRFQIQNISTAPHGVPMSVIAVTWDV